MQNLFPFHKIVKKIKINEGKKKNKKRENEERKMKNSLLYVHMF